MLEENSSKCLKAAQDLKCNIEKLLENTQKLMNGVSDMSKIQSIESS